MKNVTLAVLLCALALGVVGCKKKGPSPEYAEAAQQWTQLLRDRGEGAYTDARADAILAKLGSVPADSQDAQAAGELKGRIEQGRKDAKDREAHSAQLVAGAEAALHPSMPASAEPSPGTPAQGDKPAAPAEAAKAPEMKEPGEGMDEATLKSKYDRCFEKKYEVNTSEGVSGDVYGLKDLSLCRDQFPRFVSSSAVVLKGKVVAVRSNEELAPRKFKVVNGQLVPLDPNEPEPKPTPPAQPATPEPAPSPTP